MTVNYIAILRSLLLFALAGLAEIGGGYLVWQWWRIAGAGEIAEVAGDPVIAVVNQALEGRLANRQGDFDLLAPGRLKKIFPVVENLTVLATIGASEGLHQRGEGADIASGGADLEAPRGLVLSDLTEILFDREGKQPAIGGLGLSAPRLSG